MAWMNAVVREGATVSLARVRRPTVVKADDVVVRVAFAGICRTDLYVADGTIDAPSPIVLGHELAGRVEAVGADVIDVAIGTAVTVNPQIACRRCAGCGAGKGCWQAEQLGVARDGAFAELVCVPRSALIPLPSSVALRAGAYVEPIAAALGVLDAGIHPEQRGAVHGDNRIARLTMQLLRLHGFADVRSITDPDLSEKNAYDFIVESGATAEAFAHMVDAVRPGGRLVLKSRSHEALPLVPADLVRKDLTLRAIAYGSFDAAVALLASGKLELDSLFGPVHRLDAFADAFARARREQGTKHFFAIGEEES